MYFLANKYFVRNGLLIQFFLKQLVSKKENIIPSNIQRAQLIKILCNVWLSIKAFQRNAAPTSSHFFNVSIIWFPKSKGKFPHCYIKGLNISDDAKKVQKVNVFHALLIGFGFMGHFVSNPSFEGNYLFSAEREEGWYVLLVECSLGSNWCVIPTWRNLLCLLQQELNWKERGRPTHRWGEYL